MRSVHQLISKHENNIQSVYYNLKLQSPRVLQYIGPDDNLEKHTKILFIVFILFTHKKNAPRDMENNNAQEVAPVRLNRPRKSRCVCQKHTKLMENNDPRIIKLTPNHAHQCALCKTTLSLSCTENNHMKHGKANDNC